MAAGQFQEVVRLPADQSPSIIRMPASSKKVRERYELSRIADDETLNRAFQLAHSIYCYREGDRKIALEILSDAVRGVEVRLMSQDEADRHGPQRPTKVRWSAAQWFQLLIYSKSERYEKQQESDNRSLLGESDMVIRYIKHLILSTCRRNSFYLTLGLSRLLYDYNTTETMAIYDLVFQDPDTSTRKADAYYRDRKIKLLNELQKRFKPFIKVCRGLRGETRFQSVEDPRPFAELVNQYLKRFTPWQTTCALPEHLSEWSAIHTLQADQVSQIHSVIHPNCFFKIIKALRLEPPQHRLAIPKFFLRSKSEDEKPSGDVPATSDLTGEELSTIREKLSDDSNRRKTFSPLSISIVVDGVERARLDLAQSKQIKLEIEVEATLIELVGHNREGDLLLGTHILNPENGLMAPNREIYSVLLESGQTIELAILAPEHRYDAPEPTTIEVGYSEPYAASTIGFWEQFKQSLARSFNLREGWAGVPLTIRFALILVMAGILGVILFRAIRGRGTEQQQIARQEPPPSIAEPETPRQSAPPRSTPNTTSQAPRPGLTGSQGLPLGGVTREQSASAVRSLLTVKRVYVQSFGDEPFGQRLRQSVIEQLRRTGRFAITDSPDDADTAVSGAASQEASREGKPAGRVTVELVNAAGDVLWPARTYRGSAEDVAAQFSRELSEAIRREERAANKNK